MMHAIYPPTSNQFNHTMASGQRMTETGTGTGTTTTHQLTVYEQEFYQYYQQPSPLIQTGSDYPSYTGYNSEYSSDNFVVPPAPSVQSYAHPNYYTNHELATIEKRFVGTKTVDKRQWRGGGDGPSGSSVGNQSNSNVGHLQHLSNSNGREARNRAEKNRRDKLNGSIHELTTMVPHVADSPRRVDKTAILRFAAHGLRIDYVFGKQILKFSDETNGLMDIFLKLLDSFLITVTCKGQIILVSSSIEQHLGHCQTDLYGQDLLQFTHPDDQLKLKQQLIPNDLERLFDIQPDDDAGEPRKRSQDEEDEIDRRLCEDRRRFTIRLARAAPRSEPKTYENVRIDGCFRRADFAPRGIKSSTFPAGLHLIRRSRGRDDSLPLQTISGNDIVLVAMAHVIKPPTICDRVLEACKCEYKTRHLTDGRIVQCDQRISIVAGYMPDEVSGLSPFTFMHKDDVRWVMVALRQMYDYSSPIGESCYRLITRTGQFVYLRTRGFLEIDKESNEVRSFICYNTLMSEEDGRKLVHEMKKKYAILIHNHNFSSTDTDVPAVEHPVKIHRAVLNLITNLHRGHNDPVSVGASPRSTDNPPPSIEEIDPDVVRNITSPPLSIIAPLPDTIEPSISKSVNVIVTSKKGQSVDAPDDSDYLPEPESCNQTRSTVLHRAIKSEPSTSCSPSNRPTTSKIISLDSDGGAYIKQEPCDLTFDSTDAIPTCLPPFNEESFDGFDLSGDMSTTMTDLQLLTTLESEPPSPEDSGKRQLKRSCRYVDTNTTKRRSNLTIDETDLKTALPASFNELDCSLQDVHDETSVMSKRLRVCYPEANRKLDEIIVERERQLNLLNAIRGEYQSCIQDGASALSDSLKIRKTAK